jgi:uncharacterized protein (DUF1778 family)
MPVSSKPQSKSLKKTTRAVSRLNLRTTGQQEALIRTGAETRGMNVSQYILETVCRQAEQDLADQCHFQVSEEKMKAFLAALDQPPQPKPRMKRLLSEPSVLEKAR